MNTQYVGYGLMAASIVAFLLGLGFKQPWATGKAVLILVIAFFLGMAVLNIPTAPQTAARVGVMADNAAQVGQIRSNEWLQKEMAAHPLPTPTPAPTPIVFAAIASPMPVDSAGVTAEVAKANAEIGRLTVSYGKLRNDTMTGTVDRIMAKSILSIMKTSASELESRLTSVLSLTGPSAAPITPFSAADGAAVEKAIADLARVQAAITSALAGL